MKNRSHFFPLAVAGSLLFASTAPAEDNELRTFTNNKGQSLEATVKGIDGDTVTLRMNNGQEYPIAVSTLSAADQEYLKAMAAPPEPGGPAPVDSDVPLEAINELFGHELFADGNLWENDSTDTAARLDWPRESQTPYSSSYRKYTKADYNIAGARPYSAVLYGEDGKVSSLSIVFANKGDFFGAAGGGEQHFVKGEPVPDGIDGLRAIMERDTEAISERLSEKLGAPKRQKFGEGETRTDVQRWDWSGHSFLLSSVEDEYVSLALQPVEFADDRGKVSRVSDAVVRERARGNVETRENGDVVINNIPMVDQGPKGYCVPATAERCMRYLGIPADMYLLAMAGQTQIGGGTSPTLLFNTLQRDIKRKGRSLETWNGDLKLRDVVKRIDDGIPVMWALHSTRQFNDIANSRTKMRAEGTDWAAYQKEVLAAAKDAELEEDDNTAHIVIIIGYNEATDEIAFSDSWGERYLERWITVTEAAQVSQGFFYAVDF